MDRLGYQFFAGARLAGHQDRNVRAGVQLRMVEQAQHVEVTGQNVGEGRWVGQFLLDFAPPLEFEQVDHPAVR